MTVYVKKHSDDLWHYTSGLVVPKVGHLFIDKLSLTSHVPAHLREVTKAKFDEAVHCGNAYKISKTVYEKNLKLSTSSEGNVLIQCSPPQDKKMNYFRLEMNPSKANLYHMRNLLDYILEDCGGYENLMETGIVTRTDFTVDVDYINHADVLAIDTNTEDESHFGKNGQLETKYLGSSASDNQLMVYDKIAEMTSPKNKKKYAGEKTPAHKRLRVEYKTTNTSKTMKELEKLKCPFESLFLTAYPNPKTAKEYDPMWSLFLSVCRFEGIANALLHLSEHDQAIFHKRLLTEGRSDWWKPAKIWDGLPAALKVITQAKGYHPNNKLIA